MSDFERKSFLKKFSQNLGLTFSEFLFNEEYHKHLNIKFENHSEMSEILEAVKINRPVLIVSGHIGPWEAVRALLRKNGVETAAKRKVKRFYHSFIATGGKPILKLKKKLLK